MENWLSQLGAGTKHLTERVAEYPGHDQQLYYQYEPSSPAHGHGASLKHHYGGGGGGGGGGGSHKSNAAMSALTLLAFLFFLHILQQCLKEHMTAMTSPQVMVVSAGRQGEQLVSKSVQNKLDKAGRIDNVVSQGIPHGVQINELGNEDVAPSSTTDSEIVLERIATAEHTPKDSHGHKNKIVHYTNRSSIFDGFVSAMDEK